MSEPQTSSQKGNNKVLLIVLAIAAVVFFIYGFTQHQLAQKFEERHGELEKKNLELLNKTIDLAKKLDRTINEDNKKLILAAEKLQDCQDSKRK